MKTAVIALLLTGASASPSGYGGSTLNNIIGSLQRLVPGLASGDYAPVTSQIINDYSEPVKVARRPGSFELRPGQLTKRLGASPPQQLRSS